MQAALLRLDAAAILWLDRHHLLVLDRLALAVTMLGDVFGLVLLVCLYFGLPRARFQLRPFIVGLSTSGVVLSAIRTYVHRTRPCVALAAQLQHLLVEPILSATSWPSGHATVGGSIAAGALLLRWPQRWAFVVVGALVALSRIYLALHYPTDIATGFLLGATITSAACLLWRRHVEPPQIEAAVEEAEERGEIR